MFGRTVLLASQGVAVLSILFAIPPVWQRVGKREGLAISLSLFLLYLSQGFYHVLKGRRRKSQLFHLMELPLLFLTLTLAIRWMPNWSLWPYEQLVHISGPILILLEGSAFLFNIFSVGSMLAHKLNFEDGNESDDDMDADADDLGYCHRLARLCRPINVLRGLTLIATFCLFLLASLWLYSIYYQASISITTAGLTSSVLTLFLVIFLASFLMDNVSSVILEPCLILLYIVYNIWVISKEGDKNRPHQMVASQSSLWSAVDWPWNWHWSLYSFSIYEIMEAYTAEIVINLLFRVSIYLLSSSRLIHQRRRYGEDGGSDSEDDALDTDSSPQYKTLSIEEEMSVSNLLQSFGKCILILIYTLSWLESYESGDWKDWRSSQWRWLNTYYVLALYFWHLYVMGKAGHDE